MSDRTEQNSKHPRAYYNANYSRFHSTVYEEIRREAFGEDIGQHSWLTVDEQDRFIARLNLTSGRTLVDVGCGAGGPALRIAATTGCSIVGIDTNEEGIAAARELAARRDLQPRAEFHVADAQGPLALADGIADAITCIDAINHLPDRPRAIAEWCRLLKPGGRLLFTDPAVVTGPLTNAEIAVRSSIGFFLFVPADYDEHVVRGGGLRLLAREDVTANMATVAERRRAARAARRSILCEIEGEETYQAQQAFLATAARLAAERRLSRLLIVAERVSDRQDAVTS